MTSFPTVVVTKTIYKLQNTAERQKCHPVDTISNQNSHQKAEFGKSYVSDGHFAWQLCNMEKKNLWASSLVFVLPNAHVRIVHMGFTASKVVSEANDIAGWIGCFDQVT